MASKNNAIIIFQFSRNTGNIFFINFPTTEIAGPKRRAMQTEPKIFVLSPIPAKYATGAEIFFFAKYAARSPMEIAE